MLKHWDVPELSGKTVTSDKNAGKSGLKPFGSSLDEVVTSSSPATGTS